jgi:hypothetical protein
MAARDDRRDQPAEQQARLERRARAHRQIDVKTGRARRLEVAVDAERSSSSRTQRATSRTRANGAPSIGSRSMATKSARCGDCARENHGSCEIDASWTM